MTDKPPISDELLAQHHLQARRGPSHAAEFREVLEGFAAAYQAAVDDLEWEARRDEILLEYVGTTEPEELEKVLAMLKKVLSLQQQLNKQGGN